jgi:hypothetical protein
MIRLNIEIGQGDLDVLKFVSNKKKKNLQNFIYPITFGSLDMHIELGINIFIKSRLC